LVWKRLGAEQIAGFISLVDGRVDFVFFEKQIQIKFFFWDLKRLGAEQTVDLITGKW